MPLRVFTDKLQEEGREMEHFGMDIEPVDAFGGYVAVDKYASNNLQKTNENIQWKTALNPTIGFINTRDESDELGSEDGK